MQNIGLYFYRFVYFIYKENKNIVIEINIIVE